MTRIITTPKALLVEVPEGAAIFRLIGNAETGYYLEVYDKDDFGLCTIQLPPASYGEPVLASEMTEGQAIAILEIIVDDENTGSDYYRVYDKVDLAVIDPMMSFASLLRAHSLKPETTIVIPIN